MTKLVCGRCCQARCAVAAWSRVAIQRHCHSRDASACGSPEHSQLFVLHVVSPERIDRSGLGPRINTFQGSFACCPFRCHPVRSRPVSSTKLERQLTVTDASERVISTSCSLSMPLQTRILTNAIHWRLVPQDPTRKLPHSPRTNRNDQGSVPCSARQDRHLGRRSTQMSDSATIVQKLWNYCNVLRDDGLSYQDYIEQLTFLLFLKMADEQTRAPFNRPSIVPDGLGLAFAGPSRRRRPRCPLPTPPRRTGEAAWNPRGHLPQGSKQDPRPSEAEAARL